LLAEILSARRFARGCSFLNLSSRQEAQMVRERTQKIVLIIVGVLFVATVYPLLQMPLDESLQMMLSVYATLGIFLLLASRNPSANRSLIAFTAWSSLAHAAVMAFQSRSDVGERTHLLVGTLAFGVIGLALMLVSPARAVALGQDVTPERAGRLR
jgi:hypothetical protein